MDAATPPPPPPPPPLQSLGQRSFPSQRDPRHPRYFSFSSGQDAQNFHSDRADAVLRRGHSDGDVLSTSPPSRSAGNSAFPFASHSPSTASPSRGEASRDAGVDYRGTRERAEMILADRMRRMSRQQDLYSRRRSASHASLSQSRGPPRHRINSGGSGEETSSRGAPSFQVPSSDLDRPLPQRPDEEEPRNNRNRDISVPRWQSDSEVSSCPICHTSFSFWYRKHHCRKCGRVVCANCSPHRITIPRQYIVHPPEEIAGDIVSTIQNFAPGTIRDGSERHTASSNFSEPLQTPEPGIDPALGGGQEVRLCNPCVPDPNPTPYPAFYPPRHPSGTPYPGLDRFSDSSPHSSSMGQSGISENQYSPFGHRSSLSRSRYRPSNRHDHSPNVTGPVPLVSPPASGLFTNSQHAQTHRGSNGHPSLSNLVPEYGSAPDQWHEVSKVSTGGRIEGKCPDLITAIS